MRVYVLIPAHNEAENLYDTVKSLWLQTREPDLITVVADNCSDDTYRVAQVLGVDICKTSDNPHKKGGALNQALDWLITDMANDEDAVLVMDADSILEEHFIERALRYLETGKYGGVGGVFQGKPGGGFVGMLQRNEYARYARDVHRKRGKALVLTGTATLFHVGTLRQVRAAREIGLLPGPPTYYDTEVLTEDSEISLALLHLGREIIAPAECQLLTEVMPTWRDLWNQRLRWKRGAVENLFQYGINRTTLYYWWLQVVGTLGIIVCAFYVLSVIWTLLVAQKFHIYPLWLIVTGVFALERAVTVRSRGWKQMFLASLLFVEMVFDLTLQAVQAKAYWQAFRKSERKW